MRYLCLGNNSEDTDHRTRTLCKGETYHGLLSECNSVLSKQAYQSPGWYHSSVFDIDIGRLKSICQEFDKVIVLDQPRDTWTHPDAFLNTVRLGIDVNAVFENANTKNSVTYWTDLVKTNPSFCIFPFVELVTNFDHTTVCCRSMQPVTFVKNLEDYRTDKKYQAIRNKMLEGEKIPEHCAVCYRYESLGIVSARQQETVEWANRLKLSTVADLNQLAGPAYYEIRASNKCNLNCRMCNPYDSNRIEKIYKRVGWLDPREQLPTKNSQGFEQVNLDSVVKLYVSGGEPTIMPEFHEFLEQCVAKDRVDFEILVNTNGTRFSNRFRQLVNKFSNMQFIFSLDGYDRLNDYIRHPSSFWDIVANWNWLLDQGHKVSVNTTVSIYNINELQALFDFIDTKFPGTLIHCQSVDFDSKLTPLNYPDPDEVLEGLYIIRNMDCYRNDTLFASFIDGMINQYQTCYSFDKRLWSDFKDYDEKFTNALVPSAPIRNTRLLFANPNLAAYMYESF